MFYYNPHTDSLITKFPFLLLALFIILFSCTPNKTQQSTRPVTTNTKSSTVPAKRTATYRSSKPKTIDTTNIPAFTTMRVPGWRVQLKPIDNKNKMIATRTTLLRSFDQHKIYTVYHSPFYKIRVGDFKLKSDASKLKTKLQAKFPGDALYIVQDSIEYRMPRAELIALKMKQVQ